MIFAQLQKEFPIYRVCFGFSLVGAAIAVFLYAGHVNGVVALIAGAAVAVGGGMLFRAGWRQEGFHYFLDSLKSALAMAARQPNAGAHQNPLFEQMQRLDLHRSELIYQITRKKQPSKTYVGTILLVLIFGSLVATALGAYLHR